MNFYNFLLFHNLILHHYMFHMLIFLLLFYLFFYHNMILMEYVLNMELLLKKNLHLTKIKMLVFPHEILISIFITC